MSFLEEIEAALSNPHTAAISLASARTLLGIAKNARRELNKIKFVVNENNWQNRSAQNQTDLINAYCEQGLRQ